MKKSLFLVALTLLTMGAQAKVRLPHILGDNMILQQNTDARLWGWAKPGRTVKVTTSWTKDVVTAKADQDGRWLLTVKTPAASFEPLSITFDDGDKLTLNGILSGEVWVCAGQSNMEMPVKGFGNCPVEGYNDAVITANDYKGVHYVKIPSIMRVEPQEDADCHWEVVSPQTVGDASATGYFFAQVVTKALNVPVGLIMANKGGSRVESWLTKENLEKYTNEPTDSAGIVAFKPEWDYHRALLWLLVDQWRSQFRLGEIPFYFVEIAPFHYDDVNADNAARLREQQYRASKIIPNSGLVCTNDLAYPYETTQIHPAQKKPVGQRLAYLALNKTYGMDAVGCMSMSFKDMRVVGDTVHIHVADDLGGISRFEDIQGFEIAGEDRVFHKATAEHFWQPGGGYWDETIRIFSPEVQNPVAVRYCFRNFQLGNLKNAAGLPLFPFRTDTW